MHFEFLHVFPGLTAHFFLELKNIPLSEPAHLSIAYVTFFREALHDFFFDSVTEYPDLCFLSSDVHIGEIIYDNIYLAQSYKLLPNLSP